MAKDIIVDTQQGDLVMSEGSLQTSFWDVVWGRLFDTDGELEYMNIIVPSKSIGLVRYKDGEYECFAKASYRPVNSEFLVRLVVKNIATDGYNTISDYQPNAPEAMGAVYYPKYSDRPQNIHACQLPLVDSDGKFKVVFAKYGDSAFARAIIASPKDMNFIIDESDSQSAQLLAQCAPGKYYRYPTTGLDLTKYINSVVEHTDMTSQLLKQYSADFKQVTEAEFDSNTGDLQVVFSGTSEADDQNLTDPDKLDVELFRIADDDFVREAYRASKMSECDNAEFISGIEDTPKLIGIYDVGCSAKLGPITPDSIEAYVIDDYGEWIPSGSSYVATMELKTGKIYAVNYTSSIIKQARPRPGSLYRHWGHDPLFTLSDDNDLLYVDAPFSTRWYGELIAYKNTFANRRCFIPLVDCTVTFYAGDTEDYLKTTGYGIRPITDVKGNYSSLILLMESPITGKLIGVISSDSIIKDIKIDVKTNQILIIK